MNTLKQNVLGLCALLITSALAPAQGETPPPSPQPVDAGARMAAAEALVEGLKGIRGPERLAGMRQAADAYEAVAKDFAGDAGTRVRALWEAGECWRRAADLEKAADAYARLLADTPGRYEQRAAFEQAGMLRRLKRYDEALALYRRAGGLEIEGVRAHDARIWVARVLELSGDPEAAVAAYRAAADAAVGPRRSVEACDELAKVLIRRGDLDGAAAAIERAVQAAQPVIEDGGEAGSRMQRVLDEMGSRRQLQRARDRADGTAKDAVDLESARR
jgi:tetratricopeptide (TPR) repeat protein